MLLNYIVMQTQIMLDQMEELRKKVRIYIYIYMNKMLDHNDQCDRHVNVFINRNVILET